MGHRKSKRQRQEDGRVRPRNPFAVQARERSGKGGGFHSHPGREDSRTCCRENLDPNDYEDWREELDLEDDG